MRDIKELYKRFLNKQCSPEEVERLFDYFRLATDKHRLEDLIREELLKDAPELPDSPQVSDILQKNRIKVAEIIGRDDNTMASPHLKTDPHLKTIPRRKSKVSWYLTAAASFIGLCCLLGIYFNQWHAGAPEQALTEITQDANPGSERAVLTLADGSTLVLDALDDGTLTKQSGVAITKADGRLNYEVDQAFTAHAETGFNTITVPRGGKYQVVLPDGSRVWLNAESELTYPVYFTGSTRAVTLKGEGYFEVTHRPEQPFIVKSKGQEVTVLGTHFNIKAYENEPFTETTLVSGSVRVRQSGTGAQRLLIPGEQAKVNESILDVARISVDEQIAWKDNQFVFRNTDIRTVMRQLERWYNVELATEHLPENHFYGEISRDVKLSEIFEMIELTSGLKFKLEGRKIKMQ